MGKELSQPMSRSIGYLAGTIIDISIIHSYLL